jgi:cyclohexa-1,5-dienecarbonyl-CoA hydratase
MKAPVSRSMAQAAGPTIELRTEGRTAWITLDRPPLNILDTSMMKALSRTLAQLLDPQGSRCDFLIFCGAGAKAFSAGAEVADHTPERIGGMLAAFHHVFRQLARAECISIAAVHGHCLGGGMELASFCDFVMATKSAQFGQPEIKLGCFPPVAMVTLPALLGPRAAVDLILTGRTISAAEAQALGFVSRVVDDAELDSAVRDFIGEQRNLSPAVLKLTCRCLRRELYQNFEADLSKMEQIYLNQLMKIEDSREGIRAFLEKRAPAWRGR